MVEAPVSQIGMRCKEILQLIENGPKGSETLVTRILHILTESEQPTKELVAMVSYVVAMVSYVVAMVSYVVAMIR